MTKPDKRRRRVHVDLLAFQYDRIGDVTRVSVSWFGVFVVAIVVSGIVGLCAGTR